MPVSNMFICQVAIQGLSEDKTWSPIYTLWFLNKFSNPDLTDWICLIISNFPHILLKYIILHDWLLFPWDHDFPDITMLPHIMAMWSWNHTESSLPIELNISQYTGSCGFVYRSSIPTITEGFQMHIQKHWIKCDSYACFSTACWASCNNIALYKIQADGPNFL